MQKISNKTSSLIDAMVKAAAQTKPKPIPPINLSDILKNFKPAKESSLREILAQVDPSLSPAPMADPAAPLGSEPDAGTTCPDAVVQKLVDALIEACGDAETAKAKIDELGGGASIEEGVNPNESPVDSVGKDGNNGIMPPPPPPQQPALVPPTA